jgi:hypothetical protein
MNPEFLACSIIAGAAEMKRDLPECVGPIFLHVDGNFECHGAGCVAAAPVSCLDSHFHGDDSVHPCSLAGDWGMRLRGLCVRCETDD